MKTCATRLFTTLLGTGTEAYERRQSTMPDVVRISKASSIVTWGL